MLPPRDNHGVLCKPWSFQDVQWGPVIYCIAPHVALWTSNGRGTTIILLLYGKFVLWNSCFIASSLTVKVSYSSPIILHFIPRPNILDHLSFHLISIWWWLVDTWEDMWKQSLCRYIDKGCYIWEAKVCVILIDLLVWR